MENKKRERLQIAFDVSPELKADIKCAAAIRNISLSLWLNRCIRKELRATMGNPIKHCECFKEQ